METENRVNIENYAYKPTKFDYFYLLYKIVKNIFSYFFNGFTFVTTMILSYNCYYDSIMYSDENWKLPASIILFLSLFMTICFNFIYFSNFMYYKRIEYEKELLKPRHFLILYSYYQKKIPKFKNFFLIFIFNFTFPIFIASLDILFYCSSSNIRLLLRLYCIRDGKTHEEVKNLYKVTYKIMLIGFILLDIPTGIISILILSSKNKKIFDNNLSSSNLSAIYCLIRITITLTSHLYTILRGFGLEWCKNLFQKKTELETPLVNYK